MKICLINNLYGQFSHGGGAEQITKLIADNLPQQKTFVISTKPYKTKIKTDDGNYYLNSFFPLLNKFPIFIRLFWHILDMFGWYKAKQIKNILKKERPDLIITNNLKGLSFLTPRVIKKLKIKHVHILHDIQLIHPSGVMYYGQEKKINNRLSKLYISLNKWNFKKIDLVVSPSQWLLKLHLNLGFFKNTKTKHILNPKNTTSYNQKIVQNKNKEKFFLYVGQLEKHKGINFLIDIFEKEFNNDNLKLKIVGSGSLEKKVKTTTTYCDRIEYLGKLTNTKVQKIMSQATCLIVPSLVYENSPTVILEALNNDLLVLGSDLGGISELLMNKKFLFAPRSTLELKTKILMVKKNEFELNQELQKIKQRIQQLTPLEYFQAIKKEL